MCEIWENKRDNIMLAAVVPNSGICLEEKPIRRRILESEDSSYDSDNENTELDAASGGSVTSAKSIAVHHDEVSRTISDTLAAEYADYVTRSPLPPPGQSLLEVIVNDLNYTSRVEFGLKLGYTETQVQIALMKLGPRAGQNELLAELIKLGASGCTSGCASVCNNSSGAGTGSVSSSVPLNGKKLSIHVDDHHSNGSDDDTIDNGDCHNLRPIVIDGSNVAISHGNKECFSCMGIKICVDWFQSRGHREITVFVPMWRKEAPRPDAPIKDQEILYQLEADRLLVFTPSRNVGGRRMVCYDDRYILKLAAENDGIVVSNDNYRDLISENPEYKKVVEERLLMYSFVNDRFMPPDDPMGRHGPSLNNFLRRRPKPPEILPPPCPYGKKCTYGNKCKYYHPERGNQPQKSVTERLAENAKLQLQEVKARGKSRESSPGERLKATISLPLQICSSSGNGNSTGDMSRKKSPLSRTKSVAPTKSLPFEYDWKYQTYNSASLITGEQQNDSANKCIEENLHRKLQRQLTLNPNYDLRLNQFQQVFNQTNMMGSAENSASTGGPMGPHRQLTRMGSDGPRMGQLLRHQQQNSPHNSLFPPQPHYLSSHSQESLRHTSVTRIASAPDSHSDWSPSSLQSSIGRLNSTSDTRLNMTPPPAPFPNQIWSTGTGGLIVPPNPSSWTHVMPENSNNSLRHHSHLAPVRPSSVPPQAMNPQLLHAPTPMRSSRPISPGNDPDNDPRYKLYFHLSSIFPEEQVRAAMEIYPDETNAQSICAAILTMFPKG